MDSNEERDFAYQGGLDKAPCQGPMTDVDMQEDDRILAAILKDICSCMIANDIEQLLQDIPVQPPVAIPVRTVQEAAEAGHTSQAPRGVDCRGVECHPGK